MNGRRARYSCGRAFSVLFISLLLGASWGATAVGAAGIVAWAFHLGESAWHLLATVILTLSVSGVKKVAALTPAQAGAAEAAKIRTDSRISTWSFAAAYILVWISMWALVAHTTSSIVI